MFKKIMGLFSGDESGRKNNPSSPRRIAPRLERGDDDATGEHFEYFGDMWDAILGDVSLLESMLEKIVRNGEMRPDCRVTGKKDKAQIILLQYPKEGEIRAGSLLSEIDAGEGLQLSSCYPVLEGMPNQLIIKSTHPWSNGMEGDVTAYGIGDHPSLTFHAPFFFRDSDKFEPKTELMVDLGALALSIEPVGAHEARPERFLKKNPEKEKADFSSPLALTPRSRFLFPTKHACEWTFCCPILAVKPVLFQKTQLYRMTVVFIGVDGEVLSGYLYASQHILQGYIPKAGDDVEGVLWMTGSLSKASSGGR